MDKARFLLKKSGLEALLVSNEINIFYLTGYPGKDSYLLLTRANRDYFFADSRVCDEVKTRIKYASIVRIEKMDTPVLRQILRENRVKKIGFESHNLTYSMYKRLSRILNTLRLKPAEGIIESLRAKKSKAEFNAIRRASSVTKTVFKEIRKHVHSGLSELDIARRIDSMVWARKGVSAFETIVARGHRSAWPHACASKQTTKPDDIILMDFGAKIDHYCSDLTRVLFLGKAMNKFRKIYNTVERAQKTALNLLRPGAVISSIARQVNRIIENEGFGKFILHGLGHGVGLEIHESPGLSVKNNSRIKEGMVVTVEPGIYVPRFGGIRLEDTVYIDRKGTKVLTR